MKTKINGIEVAFEVTGKNSPPLLLMHGFGLDRSIWHELVENHLGEQQVILPDLRGHGESDVSPAPYAMSLMAQDVAGLLEFLGVDQAFVCGHSMGGYVALAFAEQFPGKLAGLGLITTNAMADSPEKRTGRYALIDEIQARGSGAAADNLAPRLSHNLDVIHQAHVLISQCDPGGLIGSLQGMAEREDKMARLGHITVPALVVAGKEDQITNVIGAQAMAEALPQGVFFELAGVGHMPMLEDAAALGQALQSLVNRVT
jgi:pimeloyl-ACP methyl ester carboxylesterase